MAGYAKIPLDMLEDFEAMTDEEAGAAIKAYLRYVASGEDNPPKGNGGFVYRAMRRDVARARERSAKRAEHKGGGRGKTDKSKAGNAEKTGEDPQPAPKQPEVRYVPQDKKPFIGEDEAERISQETNEVLEEAVRQGFDITQAVMDRITDFVSKYGAEEVTECLQIAGDAGKPNIRYLRGVLDNREQDKREEQDTPKKPVDPSLLKPIYFWGPDGKKYPLSQYKEVMGIA